MTAPVPTPAHTLPPYPAYRPSGVPWLGEVPAHWEVRRLRTVADLRVSNVDKHIVDGELPVRLCNYVDVYQNDRITASLPFMPATAKASEIARFRLAPGDVLITKDSETWRDIGVPALVEYTADDLVCGYHLALLRPKPDVITGPYLFRALQSTSVASQFHTSANGVTRYGLSHNAIKSVGIPLPPPDEQAAIASYLDQVVDRINRARQGKARLAELLQEYRQAAIHHAVTRGLNPDAPLKPSGVAWLGEVPAHWEVRRLKTMARIVNGATPSTLTPEYWGGDITWLTPEDLGRLDTAYMEHGARSITQKGYDSCGTTIAPAGSLVISTRAPIGHIAILRRPACVNQGCRLIITADAIQSGYLYYQLAVAKSEIASFGKGTTFMELSKADLASFRFACPPRAEQSAIAAHLDWLTAKLDAAIAGARQSAALLDEYRAALIAAAVTGQVDVRAAAGPLTSAG